MTTALHQGSRFSSSFPSAVWERTAGEAPLRRFTMDCIAPARNTRAQVGPRQGAHANGLHCAHTHTQLLSKRARSGAWVRGGAVLGLPHVSFSAATCPPDPAPW